MLGQGPKAPSGVEHVHTCDIDEADVLFVAACVAAALAVGFLVYVAVRGRVLFERFLDRAFDEVDLDFNHKIDLKEMHAAVLLLYLNLNYYVSVRAPSRKTLTRHFVKLAGSTEGELGREDFKHAMGTLVQNIFTRIACVLLATLATPFVASRVVDLLVAFVDAVDGGLTDVTPCQEKVIKRALDIGDFEQLANTLTSVAIVSLGMPMVFAAIDRATEELAAERDVALADKSD